MNNNCPKCGLYYNAIIEGSIPVNQCKCPPDRYILKKNSPMTKNSKEILQFRLLLKLDEAQIIFKALYKKPLKDIAKTKEEIIRIYYEKI